MIICAHMHKMALYVKCFKDFLYIKMKYVTKKEIRGYFLTTILIFQNFESDFCYKKKKKYVVLFHLPVSYHDFCEILHCDKN
jgi:hypothetical protein